jgi:hypothetical protein
MAIESVLAAFLPGVIAKVIEKKQGKKVPSSEIVSAAVKDIGTGLTQGKGTTAAGGAIALAAVNVEALGFVSGSPEALGVQAIMAVVAFMLALYRGRQQ